MPYFRRRDADKISEYRFIIFFAVVCIAVTALIGFFG
jgi:hypothetical protein